MAIHRIYIEGDAPLAAGAITITGDEAHHAIRVKRLAAGDQVEILDGRGGMSRATIIATEKAREGWQLAAQLEEPAHIPPVAPHLEVLCPPPKGPRLSELIDGLSQAGAASWSALTTALTQHEPRETRIDRTRRIAAESSKQCGRPWLLEVGPPRSLQQVLAECGTSDGPPLIIADATGSVYERTGAPVLRLLVGPEGGWRPDELDAARAAGAIVARFGPHTMRIETAAVVAAGIILDVEGRTGG